MKKKKKENDNKLHTEYGLFKNCIYILGKIKKYYPPLLVFMGISVITVSSMNYLWTFVGKFILDILERQSASGNTDITPLLQLLAIVALVLLTMTTLNVVSNNNVWVKMIYVRMRIITERVSKVLSMNYQMLEQPDILDMSSKAMQATGGNTNGVEGMMHQMRNMGTNIVTLIVTLTTIVVLDWKLILILTAIAVVQFIFFHHTVKRDKKEVWDALAGTWRKIDYMEQTLQSFDYAKDIRLFGMKKWLSGKQHEIINEKQSKMIHSRNLWMINSGVAHSLSLILTAVIHGVLIYSFLGDSISIGDFTLYVGLAMAFTSALVDMFNSFGTFKQCSLQVDDFRSFIDLPVEDETDCIPIPKADKYVFTFKNVSFKYSGQEKYALKNLNLTLEAGKRLAVVGLNGAGKTTFIKLLLRLYDVTEGEILLNGINVNRFKRAEYFELFSPVFQNVEIFAFPMAENVSMKRPSETDKELCRDYLEKAGLKEKLDSLENGVETELLKVIYENGVDLSGGEKQKLALARALYKDAPIIVLDEPTAALDPLAEYKLYKSFDDIIGNKSAVYISHRLSSTRFCDNIAMFKAGEMVEEGTHEELLAKGGAYAEMFEIQAQYYKNENNGNSDVYGEEAVLNV
ncbi:MAG: ABC transporter ATP-binding protein [Ruminococcaceae bacterium]|nr:ABC transporter ATP-binding protein [Oscillospiraceae bacterium]